MTKHTPKAVVKAATKRLLKAVVKSPWPKKSKPIDQLYQAVIKYVESNGGKIVVIGGIAIQHWPETTESSFDVAIKCLGRRPKFKGAKP